MREISDENQPEFSRPFSPSLADCELISLPIICSLPARNDLFIKKKRAVAASPSSRGAILRLDYLLGVICFRVELWPVRVGQTAAKRAAGLLSFVATVAAGRRRRRRRRLA